MSAKESELSSSNVKLTPFGDRHVLVLFASQMFLSAFLLFQIQPIVARFILPAFGGTSTVWSVCLVFFQVFLLLGYLYAHILERWLPPFKQALVHVALVILVAAMFLPIHLDVSSLEPDGRLPQVTIVLLLIASVGLPYGLISSSGPLFQSWFRRRCPNHDTYRLYALSNVGSLLGLLSYPFLIEPTFSLRQQAQIWSVGFCLYVVFTLACLWSLRGKQYNNSGTEKDGVDSQVSALDVFVWLCMAAIASSLLLATTNKITMDVASVPFLWIFPLCVYPALPGQ